MYIYWHCVIELEINEGTLPDGSDSPMRDAVENTALNLMPGSKHLNTWSGWGLSSEGAANVVRESSKGKNAVTIDDVVRRSSTHE